MQLQDREALLCQYQARTFSFWLESKPIQDTEREKS